MLINGIDIKIFDAFQSSVLINPAEITVNSMWENSMLTPLFYSKGAGFKNIELIIGFKADDRAGLNENVSKVISLLKDAIVLKLEGYNNNYKCAIVSSAIETSSRRLAAIKLSLTGYEFGDEVTSAFISDLSVNNNGTADTPATLEISTDIALNVLTVTGLTEKPITVLNVARNSPLVIDGELCTIMQAGTNKFGDTDLWEFPRLKPGNNTISLSQECTAFLAYKPRFL